MRHLLLPIACCVGGCANINSIYRTIDIGSSNGGQAIALDIKQRAIFSVPREVKYKVGDREETLKTVVICAEPSPDALAAYSASAAGTASSPESTAVQLGFAAGEAAASVGLRTQSIQLLRDGLFSNCLSYLGGLKASEFYELQRRSQNFTLGLLAIEQLTGVVKADQVALNTAAGAATGSDSTEKEEASLKEARDEQNKARTAYEKAKADLEAARKSVQDQQAKVDNAQSTVDNPSKTATDAEKTAAKNALSAEKAALAGLVKEASDRKIEMDSAARAATNADLSVAAAQQSLMLAQSRVKTVASGTGTLARAGGAAAAVTQHVSTAVVSIVEAVLKESGRGEQCNSALVEARTMDVNRAGLLLTAACNSEQVDAVDVVLPASPANTEDANLRKAIEQSKILRNLPSSAPQSTTIPRPAPKPIAPPAVAPPAPVLPAPVAPAPVQ